MFTAVVLLQIVEPTRPGPPPQALAMHMRNGLYANALYDRLSAPCGPAEPDAVDRRLRPTRPNDDPNALETTWN